MTSEFERAETVALWRERAAHRNASLRPATERMLQRAGLKAGLRVLDVGTGLGDVPAGLVPWAARRGVTLLPVGLERSRVAARLGRGRLPTVVGCAGALPFAPRSVDVVLVSQVAHHFAADAVVALLRAADRVARRGVVVADLRRSALARLLFRAGAGLLRFDATTRADGETSIRRGYARAELAALLARAGIAGRVERRPGFRLVAWWRTAGAAP